MTLPTTAVFDNFSTEMNELEYTTIGDVYEASVNDTATDVFLEKLALTLNIYYTSVLIVLGIAGNLISIIVFYKSKLRHQSTSQYLSALALSDTLFLCQLIPPWLKTKGVSTVFSQNGYCQLFVYLSYVTSNHSSWLVVAFTLERFVAVVHPLRRNAMCTVKRARLIIASLAVASLLVNLPVLWFAVPSGNDCHINVLLLAHAARFNIVDTLVAFTLPMAIIVVMNSWITAVVYRAGRLPSNVLRQERHYRGHPMLSLGVQPRTYNSPRSQQRVTRMLLIVSSVFVLLNVPAYSMRIAAYASNMGEHEYSGKWAALQQICLLCFNTNFGINFVLYCLTGQNFRRALLDTFPWLRRRRLALVALHENITDRPARASIVSTSFANSVTFNPAEATSSYTVNDEASTSALQARIAQAKVAHAKVAQARAEKGKDEAGCSGIGISAAVPESPMSSRHREQQQVVQRWRFDNSRQRRGDASKLQPVERREGGRGTGAGNI